MATNFSCCESVFVSCGDLILRLCLLDGDLIIFCRVKVLTFNNLFNVIDLAGGVDSVTSTVLLLLSDERVEVREKAAQVLGGLVHCNFLNGTKSVDLLAKFQKQISRRLPRTVRASVIQEVDMTLIIERHAGILGLCAFVDAYPYDVPEFLPSILVRLGDHLNDPQPIPVLFVFVFWPQVISIMFHYLLYSCAGNGEENSVQLPPNTL